MKTLYLLIGFLIISSMAAGQTSVYGKVTDEETGEELIYANILLNKNGAFVTGVTTDFEGNYSIPVDSGSYEMTLKYAGYSNRTITDIPVIAGQGTKLDVQLSTGLADSTIITSYTDKPAKKSLISKALTSEHIESISIQNIPQAAEVISIRASIYGKVTDEETGEELIYANIVLNKDGVFVAGASTDFEGNYSITVDPGTYEMKLSYTGYPDRVITDIKVSKYQNVELNIQLTQGIELYCPMYTPYWITPLIEQDNTSSGKNYFI